MQQITVFNKEDLLSAAFDKLNGVEFRIYFYILQEVQDGKLEISLEKLAKNCKVNWRTARRVLDILQQLKMVDRVNTGQKQILHILQSSEWQDKTASSQKCRIAKVVDNLKSFPSKVSKGFLPKMQSSAKQQGSTEPPFKGVPVDHAAVEENESCTECRIEDLPKVQDSENLTLEEKLEAAREKGWANSGQWLNDLGEAMVTVNGFFVRVDEFLQRSLESFDVAVEKCNEGLELCRAQVERLKQRKLV